MRRFVSLIFTLTLLLSLFSFNLTASAGAATYRQNGVSEGSDYETETSQKNDSSQALPQNNYYILLEDNAKLLSASQKTSLLVQARELAYAYGYDVVLLTTDDAKGKTPEGYAETYIRAKQAMGYMKENAFFFLIDMDNRQPYVWWIGNAEDMYEYSGAAETILANALNYLKNADYAGAFESVMDDAQEYANRYLNGDTPGDYDSGDYNYYNPGNNDYQQNTSPSYGTPIFVSLLLGLVSALLTVLFVSRSYKTVGITGGLPYQMKNKLNLLHSQDLLVSQNVTTRHIPKSPPPSSHSGGSSSRGGGSSISSSGSHSGGSGHTGGKF